MKPQEIERAVYIDDELVHSLKNCLEKDDEFLTKYQMLLMPKRKQGMVKRDRINYILSRVRNVLAMEYVPIQSYAGASSKSDVVHSFYMLEVLKKSVDENLQNFRYLVDILSEIQNYLIINNSPLKENNLFYEVLLLGVGYIV